MKRLLSGLSGFIMLAATNAYALPEDKGISMLPAGSALAEEVHFFHNGILMPIMTVISLFVLALLLWVIVRYNAKANPEPRKFSHNTLIEIIWTGVPIIILLIIALPSFELLFKEDVVPDGKQVVARGDGQTVDFVFPNDFVESRMVRRADHLQVILDDGVEQTTLKNRRDFRVQGWGERDLVVSLNEPAPAGASVILRGGRSTQNVTDCPMSKRYIDACEKEVVLAPTMTLKVNGYQWNWQYSYPDFGDFDFFSNMLTEDQTTPELYRFEVDNRVVVPVGETIRVTTTANDVIHAWALPSFAIKIDAVPGRINETWFRPEREGVYYGQCSEICGVKHSFMPIAVEVVSRPEFEAWVDEQRELIGLEPMFGDGNTTLAQADTAAAAE
ncbi:cytochrome c oxidase subunit II transmembrane domain-containing protein [Hyphococcus flavus]|uniref:Cytochrome c oxidase subunit 2 n=1 Tax=Hyphococcus flavus TaxID=1866326 RepID=A0AAF0CH14_9PROT|nr:cytochrome c oxidase subunit II [Hyphococcus flavus]WDI33089.1 cytochrome c oxidase subunit II transmembrane domain-containing protein [Hyphococcus flavus]